MGLTVDRGVEAVALRAIAPGSIYAAREADVSERLRLVRVAPEEEPPEVRIRGAGETARCEITDGEVRVAYAVSAGGWALRMRVGNGRVVERPVGAGEVYAELAEHGRGAWVCEATRRVAARLEYESVDGGRRAEGLEASLREGLGLRVVGLRRLQLALIEELRRGHTPAELSRRAGFVSGGRPDPTRWLGSSATRSRCRSPTPPGGSRGRWGFERRGGVRDALGRRGAGGAVRAAEVPRSGRSAARGDPRGGAERADDRLRPGRGVAAALPGRALEGGGREPDRGGRRFGPRVRRAPAEPGRGRSRCQPGGDTRGRRPRGGPRGGGRGR